MNKKRLISLPSRRRVGFTLTELLISVMLVSIMAITISIAMFRTQQRTSRTRDTLTNAQAQRNILDSITEELRWAHTIKLLNTTSIRFVMTNRTTDENIAMEYTWNDTTHVLRRNIIGQQSYTILADNIYSFDLQQADFGWDDRNQRYLRSIKIEMQIGPEGTGICQRYVHLINHPYW